MKTKLLLLIILVSLVSCLVASNDATNIDSIFESGKIGLEIHKYAPPFNSSYNFYKSDFVSSFPLWYRILYFILIYLMAIFYLTTKGYPLNLYITFSSFVKTRYNANEVNSFRQAIENVFFISSIVLLSLFFTNYLFIKEIITDKELAAYFAKFFAGFLFAFVLYMLNIKLLAYLFEAYELEKQIHYTNKIFIAVLGYPLLFANVLLLYLPSSAGIKIYWLTVAFISIAFLIRMIYIIRYFLGTRFSSFYLILYLCSIEIIPLALLFKYLVN